MAVRRRHRGRQGARPRPPQARPDAPAEAPAEVVPAAPSARRKTVIVIEDNASIGGLIVALLREDGYRALRAWDWREGLRIARDRRPDLLVLELSLPYREGIEWLAELKSHAETQAAPIVAVAGNVLNLPPEQRELLADCLSKPVDIDRLVNRVRRALGDDEHEVPPKDYSSTVDTKPSTW